MTRLIDADEAIKRLGDAHFKNYGNAIMVIRETPTVDAQPVIHGKWKKIRGTINCSACKSCSWSMFFEDLVTSFNYCPNCGAKMEAKQEKQYFPKGFFSKERPLAKGEEDGTD